MLCNILLQKSQQSKEEYIRFDLHFVVVIICIKKKCLNILGFRYLGGTYFPLQIWHFSCFRLVYAGTTESGQTEPRLAGRVGMDSYKVWGNQLDWVKRVGTRSFHSYLDRLDLGSSRKDFEKENHRSSYLECPNGFGKIRSRVEVDFIFFCL